MHSLARFTSVSAHVYLQTTDASGSYVEVHIAFYCLLIDVSNLAPNSIRHSDKWELKRNQTNIICIVSVVQLRRMLFYNQIFIFC